MMYNRLTFLIFSFFSSLAIFSCGSTENPTENTGDPSNLTIEVDVANDQSGAVTIIANATNAVLYEFDMGTTSTNDTGVSEDGTFDFVYENSGNYTIEVKAIGSSGRFIREQKQISISSGEPNTSGQGYTTPIEYEGMDLLWNDEFDGTILNGSFWTHEIGNGCPNICGWGNNELQYYRAENTTLNDGVLTINAREQNFQSNNYTSSRMKTQGKFVFTYGRVDVRAKLPGGGRGLWPAIWMLGQNITSVSWPRCGEIDIMEMIGGTESTTHGTAHWANEDGDRVQFGNDRTLGNGLDEQFHVYSIVWNQAEIKWYVNDALYHTLDITGADKDAFHRPFFLLLNVAVGGDWPGSPNANTTFPSTMEVDYVRVFQDK